MRGACVALTFGTGTGEGDTRTRTRPLTRDARGRIHLARARTRAAHDRLGPGGETRPGQQGRHAQPPPPRSIASPAARCPAYDDVSSFTSRMRALPPVPCLFRTAVTDRAACRGRPVHRRRQERKARS